MIIRLNSLGAAVAVAASILAVACESGVSTDPSAGGLPGLFQVNAKTVALAVGQTQQLSVTSTGSAVTWQSDDPDIAVVSASGLVVGAAPGRAHVLARNRKLTDTVLVTVHPEVAAIQLSTASIELTTGESASLGYRARDAKGASIDSLYGLTVHWESRLPAVAGVDSTGRVEAVAAGRAVIVLMIDGKSDSAVVSVLGTPGDTTEVPAVDAELPRVYLNTAVSNTPSNGRTLRVAAGGNLQAALDSALPGDRLLLAAGATFRGNFVIRPKTGGISGGWITVMSDGQLPPEGTRVSPAMASTYGFPKLVSPTIVSTLITDGPASRWRFIGLEITADSAVGSSQGLVLAGDASSAQYMASQVPTDLIYDRIYAHGWPTLDLRKCFAFNSAKTAIIDSYVSECHSAFDAQAVTGTNGPGPYKIVNNYLEAGSENIGFGGAPIWIPNQLPTDIEIRRNYLSKPLSWKGIWNTKNLIELKDGVRILIEGNVLENSYPDAQAGFALMLWSANAVNNCSWCITQDITVRNNVIRNVAAGIAMASRYDASTLGMRNVTIRNNVMIGLDNPAVKGNGRIFQIQDTIPNLTIEHNTAFSPTNSSIIWGGAAPQVNHIVRNNLMGGGLYQLFAAGVGMGQIGWAYEDGSGSVLTNNVVALADAASYPANNFYPTSLDAIGLAGGGTAAYSVSAALSDLALSSTSPYKGKATDGTDLGADIAAIAAATANVKP